MNESINIIIFIVVQARAEVAVAAPIKLPRQEGFMVDRDKDCGIDESRMAATRLTGARARAHAHTHAHMHTHTHTHTHTLPHARTHTNSQR